MTRTNENSTLLPPSGPLQTIILPGFDNTTNSAETTMSSFTADDVFQLAVVLIGIVGMAANGFVIYVKICRLKEKQLTHILILNQLVLDLFSCISLVITYLIKLCKLTLDGPSGYWLCMLVLSDLYVWIGFEGSTFNLGAIAIERYLKICHPLWHKAHFRCWMVYVPAVFIWLGAIMSACGVTIPTTAIVYGQCYSGYFWPNSLAQLAYGIWNFLSFYAILIAIFIFCYSKIFIALKVQQKIFNGAVTVTSSHESSQHKQTQLNILKMTFLLTLSFSICWLPNTAYYLLVNSQPAGLTFNNGWYYGTLFFGFFNICTNPFIYGAKSELINSCIRKITSHCVKTNNSTVQQQRSEFHQQQLNVGIALSAHSHPASGSSTL